MKNIILLSRHYPSPGGRNNMLGIIIENLGSSFNFTLLSWFNISHSAVRSKIIKRSFDDTTYSEYQYYLETFIELMKINKKST